MDRHDSNAAIYSIMVCERANCDHESDERTHEKSEKQQESENCSRHLRNRFMTVGQHLKTHFAKLRRVKYKIQIALQFPT